MADGAEPPTLDRDALKLLFRNALAQKAVKNSAGMLITKMAAVNKMCLDSIVRVTNQFRNAILTTDNIVLKRDGRRTPAIRITRSEFAWMAQWEMLRLQTLTIASENMGDWHSLIELFQMPSLRVLRCACPLRRRPPRNPISASFVVLAAEIVKLNSSNIQELDCVPVWKLSERLPLIHLKKFVFETQALEHERLDNLSRCTVDVLEVRTHRSQVPLDFLAGVDAMEIKFMFYASRVGVDHFTATEGATKTRCHPGEPIPCLWSLHEIGQYLATDPAMPVLAGHVLLIFEEEKGVTHSWTVENVSNQLRQNENEMRAALELVPPRLEVTSVIYRDFHHIGESQTREADKLVTS